MAETFNDLLEANGVDPREVSLLRHKLQAGALRARSIEAFELYQLTQEADRNVFRQPRYWASFLAEPNLQTRFVGLYEVVHVPDGVADWNDPLTGGRVGAGKLEKRYDVFSCWRSPILSEHIDSLTIDWDRSERSWAQHAATSSKRIVSIKSAIPKIGLITEDIPAVDRATSRVALAMARRGQGKFREDLLSIWDGRCCVTGYSLPILLRASHIKPWWASTDAERLDPANGLLLSVHLDALFDNHFISFGDDGRIVRAPHFPDDAWSNLGLHSAVITRPLASRTKAYLRNHRAITCRRRVPLRD